jgi:hypothetical protein
VHTVKPGDQWALLCGAHMVPRAITGLSTDGRARKGSVCGPWAPKTWTAVGRDGSAHMVHHAIRGLCSRTAVRGRARCEPWEGAHGRRRRARCSSRTGRSRSTCHRRKGQQGVVRRRGW